MRERIRRVPSCIRRARTGHIEAILLPGPKNSESSRCVNRSNQSRRACFSACFAVALDSQQQIRCSAAAVRRLARRARRRPRSRFGGRRPACGPAESRRSDSAGNCARCERRTARPHDPPGRRIRRARRSGASFSNSRTAWKKLNDGPSANSRSSTVSLARDRLRSGRAASDELLVARSQWPFLDQSSGLRRLRHELRERIDPGVQAQESLEHAGEEKRARADVFLLVELDRHFQATGEAAARRGCRCGR